MAKLSRARALRVQVAVIPTKWETYAWLVEPEQRAASEAPSGFAASMEALCRRHGFGFTDLKPPLVAEARLAWRDGEYVFWPDDSHWNARGQRVAVEVLAPLLAQ